MVSFASLALHYLPPFVQEQLANFAFDAMPLQLHAIVLGIFASAIAPFGAFMPAGVGDIVVGCLMPCLAPLIMGASHE